MSGEAKGQGQPATGGFGGKITPTPATGGSAQRGKAKFQGTYTPPKQKPEGRTRDSD